MIELAYGMLYVVCNTDSVRCGHEGSGEQDSRAPEHINPI